LFLPSLGENFGHVIVEALSAGCPILISDRTPWRGLAERGVGWDLPLEDPAGFRGVIDACCVEEFEERRRRAELASAWAASLAPDESDLAQHAALLGDRNG
jgi:glycosyltransferase involved in cell wall biosynthesis